jgi:hypothetical protein
VTGIDSTSVIGEAPAAKLTCNEQLAPGASWPQVDATVKFVVRVVGAPIETDCVPVFWTDTFCASPTSLGRFANVRESGEIAMPGSAVPLPERGTEAIPPEVLMLSNPLLVPVPVGTNCAQTEHEAAYAKLPAHPPLPSVDGAILKLPEAETEEMVTAAPEDARFVSVTRVAPLTLSTGIVPKSSELGDRMSPLVAIPAPVSCTV